MAAMIFITKIHFSRKPHFQAQISVRCRSDPIKQLILKDCKLRRVFPFISPVYADPFLDLYELAFCFLLLLEFGYGALTLKLDGLKCERSEQKEATSYTPG